MYAVIQRKRLALESTVYCIRLLGACTGFHAGVLPHSTNKTEAGCGGNHTGTVAPPDSLNFFGTMPRKG